jgi:hypothetical protein
MRPIRLLVDLVYLQVCRRDGSDLPRPWFVADLIKTDRICVIRYVYRLPILQCGCSFVLGFPSCWRFSLGFAGICTNTLLCSRYASYSHSKQTVLLNYDKIDQVSFLQICRESRKFKIDVARADVLGGTEDFTINPKAPYKDGLRRRILSSEQLRSHIRSIFYNSYIVRLSAQGKGLPQLVQRLKICWDDLSVMIGIYA